MKNLSGYMQDTGELFCSVQEDFLVQFDSINAHMSFVIFIVKLNIERIIESDFQ